MQLFWESKMLLLAKVINYIDITLTDDTHRAVFSFLVTVQRQQDSISRSSKCCFDEERLKKGFVEVDWLTDWLSYQSHILCCFQTVKGIARFTVNDSYRSRIRVSLKLCKPLKISECAFHATFLTNKQNFASMQPYASRACFLCVKFLQIKVQHAKKLNIWASTFALR